MSIRFFLCVFVVSVYGCSVAESESVSIKGARYTYSISKEYVKLSDSIIDSSGLVGDTAKSVLLQIALSESSTNSKNDVAVMMFLDRDYGRLEELGQFARNMLKEARKVETLNGYRFVEELGSRTIDYESSFDPFSEAVLPNKNDYFVQMIEPEVIDIPGVKVLTPKITCTVWFVNDGILFQIAVFEKLCSNRAYGSLLSSLSLRLDKWRVPAK